MRFSASRVKTWGECPLQAHYTYDLGYPRQQNAKASWGTVMHRCLQIYNDTGGNYHQAVAAFSDLWEHPDKLGVAPDLWPKSTSYMGLRKRGLDILADFHARQRFQNRIVLGTEIPFVVPFGEHELHGYIDLLEIKKSGTGTELLRVVDYKGNTREPNRAELALDLQFSTYLYAVAQKEFWVGNGQPESPGLPNGEWLWETVGDTLARRAIWYHLWNQKEIDAGPRTESDFGRLYRVCEQIQRAVDHQVFVPQVGRACQLCDHVAVCSMDIPVALAAASDPDDDTRWI